MFCYASVGMFQTAQVRLTSGAEANMAGAEDTNEMETAATGDTKSDEMVEVMIEPSEERPMTTRHLKRKPVLNLTLPPLYPPFRPIALSPDREEPSCQTLNRCGNFRVNI